MKINFLLIFFSALLLSCSENEARRPVSPKPSTIISESVAQSKKMNALENDFISRKIANDTLHTYQVSTKGFWYTYQLKVTDSVPFPKKGDIAVLQYEINNLNNEVIYSSEYLGIKNYAVDKEDFIPGLQDGIKLMKVGETITFVIPSYRAFGVTGDGDKIGINQPIKSTVTLIEIK